MLGVYLGAAVQPRSGRPPPHVLALIGPAPAPPARAPVVLSQLLLAPAAATWEPFGARRVIPSRRARPAPGLSFPRRSLLATALQDRSQRLLCMR